MQITSKARIRRIRNLIIIMTLTAVMISVSTFAWFVGTRNVTITSFDVDIASTESLQLSLNGTSWSSEVSISEATLSTVSYQGHSNTWGGDGLIPLSSIGAMDNTSSRMILYEKASVTPTFGGYRIMASKIDNSDPLKAEPNGYVAFDLFIKNFSGAQYNSNLNILDEEAIYLLKDSVVTIAADGVKNTGIENSVRVAFAQIGRVKADTKPATAITGITCKTEGVVTGICREAQIWEPNDSAHVDAAISWYNKSCLKRTGTDVFAEASYVTGSGSACGLITNDGSYPTYVVSAPITSSDNVNVYDGEEYNGYTQSALLHKLDTFTDTDKKLSGVLRPEFIKLAPNSITKVRIYIYIEGQDIDNYDFASIGKKVSIKFGFTKERFTTNDIDYNGPSDPILPTDPGNS